MNTVIDLAPRRDLGLEERVARSRRARAAAAEEALRRQSEIRDRARIALVDVLREPRDPTSAS